MEGRVGWPVGQCWRRQVAAAHPAFASHQGQGLAPSPFECSSFGGRGCSEVGRGVVALVEEDVERLV